MTYNCVVYPPNALHYNILTILIISYLARTYTNNTMY